MAPARLERAAYCLGNSCSIHLSYGARFSPPSGAVLDPSHLDVKRLVGCRLEGPRFVKLAGEMEGRNLSWLASAVALALGAASPAHAFVRTPTANGMYFLWWPTRSVGHYVETSCALRPAPNQLNDEVADAGETVTGYTQACYAAIEASFEAWEDAGGQACTDLKLPFVANTTSQEIGYDSTPGAQNMNLVIFEPQQCDAVVPASDPCWDEGSCDSEYSCFSHGAEVIALTTTTYEPENGTLLDADIEINNAPPAQGGFDFSAEPVTPLAGTTDIENTVTHEAGHSIGLAHNCGYAGAPVCTPILETGVMYANAVPGETVKRTLKQDDVDGICHIYPVGTGTEIVNLLDQTGQSSVHVTSSGCSSSASSAQGWLAVLVIALAIARSRRPRDYPAGTAPGTAAR
jgi:MYXO-CTERM domain-containing protein